MPGTVHATVQQPPPSSEMIQMSRLSPELPRIDILEHEPESQMGNNLFDMFSSQFSGNNTNTNNNINNASSNNNNDTSLSVQEKHIFSEISVFPEHASTAIHHQEAATGHQGTTDAAGSARHDFDSFQFLRSSMFADREKELLTSDDPGAMQASPSSVEVEAPITKLWTECDEPHCSDGAVSCEQLEQQHHQRHQRQGRHSYEPLGKSSGKSSFFKASSSWGISRSSSVLEPSSSKPKRKRSRPCKSTEEVESQRMTHIAVERNRRRQMNDHLRVLRSLMPGSYVQRGDQASIIGGAIEFVKELQQLLQCLEEQKKRKMSFVESPARLLGSPGMLQAVSAGGFGAAAAYPSGGIRAPPPPDVKYFDAGGMYEPVREAYGEAKSDLADVEVRIAGITAKIKILSQKKPGQLLKTMTALENKLLLTIVHTNVTTIDQTVLYSFEVKVGQNCGLAEDIAAYIHNTLAASSSSISSLEEFPLQH